MLGNR
jgi:hypothetical protein